MPVAVVPQAPVLGPSPDAVAETSTSRRLNFELEEGKKGLNAVNVKVDGPLASQPEPDGGPRVVIQAKGAITDPCLDPPCDSYGSVVVGDDVDSYGDVAETKTKSKSNPPAQGSSRWVLKDDGSYIWRAGRR